MQHAALQNHGETTQSDAAILGKALFRAAEDWQLNNRDLAEILHISEASLSRLARGQSELKENSAEWQLTLLFLRLYRGLHAFMGGNLDNERLWLNAHNSALGHAPKAAIKSIEGLVRTLGYVDAIRGH